MTESSDSPLARPADRSDLTGTQLGDYQLIRRLGRGGMADVYLAQQQSLGRHVALKLLHPPLASDPSYVRRFENEARAAAALVHPNIVQIFEVGRHGELHFIAQEYVAGKTLKQLLDECGSLVAGQSVTLLRQITAALHKADQLGIVHRDIKPENVLIDDDGVAKVVDFGLAKQASQGDLGLTSTGMTMGTPYYMSPEQVQGHPLDGRSDIYSLGVTAYQMLSGRLPFEGETPMSVALKHVNTPVPDLGSAAPDTPPELSAVITKMMAKPPEARFQSSAELAATLRTIAVALGAHDQLSAATTVAVAEAENAASPSLLDATRRLSAAMQPRGRSRIPARSWWLWAGALLLGALLARSVISTDPLAAGSSLPVVPKKDSPSAQYLYASLLDTKEAWQAVLDYYPQQGQGERQRYYALRGTAQLGRWYLENGDPASAQQMFTQLSQLDSTEREFRALGIAGLALCSEAEGDLTAAADHLTDALALADELDPTTRERLERLHNRLTKRE